MKKVNNILSISLFITSSLIANLSFATPLEQNQINLRVDAITRDSSSIFLYVSSYKKIGSTKPTSFDQKFEFSKTTTKTLSVSFSLKDEYGYVTAYDVATDRLVFSNILVKKKDSLTTSISRSIGNEEYQCGEWKGNGSNKVNLYKSAMDGAYYDTTPNSKSKVETALGILNNGRATINDLEYETLKANIISAFGINNEKAVAFHLGLDTNRIVDNLRRDMTSPFDYKISEQAKTLSNTYAEYYLHYIRNIEWQKTGAKNDLLIYDQIEEDIKYNPLKEKILATMLENYGTGLEHGSHLMARSISTFKEKRYVRELKNLSKFSKGQPLLYFNFTNQYEKEITLSSFHGKTVLIDIWFTGCENCVTYYLNDLQKLEEHYSNRNDIVFVSISVDKNKTTWIESLNKGLYSSAKATNLYTQGNGSNHKMLNYYNIKMQPSVMLIDKNGRIINSSGVGLRRFSSAKKIIDEALKQSGSDQ